jgi:hypothetical protein
MKHEQRTEDSRFRTRLRRVKEVRSVQSRFVWINRGLAWMSIWRSIVSPELTKRCGVSAGMTTIPPAFHLALFISDGGWWRSLRA